ncbi:23S rRNA (uracil1939-C5)-methyltransferase [Succinivibrio dextrinosolvens]|uniref:23S rRNA (uracil(1939)-C(5))-methyltransferase RlmD n=1 Tax=Succinivibrio dextrinosolvens TaxID=83771 RepID=UPI0008EA9FD6|nr:23S rRNA (uracil(1939)-C(5))-methyltransferase RlmD [Succinivibrio dextrinosolvens]SFS39701.1 23S rRNA (uracil1939-C5)-methyltransferase [Succinivibrio dextrinosolvens]
MSKKSIVYKMYDCPCQIVISEVNSFGQGIAYYEDSEIYVEGALEGEELLVEIGAPFANGSKRRPGKIISFVRKSEDRAENFNELEHPSIYAYGHMTYEASLRKKKQDIMAAVKKAGLSADLVEGMQSCDISKPSRFKSIRHFALDNDRIINGFYKSRSHDVIEISSSKFEPAWFSDFANKLCSKLTEKKVSVYDELSGRGELRALFLRDTIEGKLCTLIVSSKASEELKNTYLNIARQFAIDSVYINVNSEKGNRILGDTTYLVAGREKVELPLCGYRYAAGPHTFLQVNYPIAKLLYEEAVRWCGVDKESVALDLCCGVGTMSLCLSPSFKEVHGIEIVEDSIIAAKDNAKLNGIDNVFFEVADITRGIPDYLKNKSIKAIICDPARAGIGDKACLQLCKLKSPLKLAYIFCSLTALSKDLKSLCSNGFKVKAVKGFDMFPFSSHVETICLLEKS